jgi:hydroxymethylpyrimidine kinase / phosphomethylpyrimidine kinase / thiamine-phosphate diphosphorylase
MSLTADAISGSRPPVVWSIAGSDSGGGAGIQADLLTCHDLGVHGCTVISAITAQNSTRVCGVDAVLIQSFVAQMDALEADLPADAIKIGLIPSRLHLEVLARHLARWRCADVEASPMGDIVREDASTAPGRSPFVIYDPVAIASTGQAMATTDLLSGLDTLLPQLDLLTPNLQELAQLTGITMTSPQSVVVAADLLRSRGLKAVLVKGGHASWQGELSLDYFCDGEQSLWLGAPRLATRHGHGTGCCYASAIAALVAQDYPLLDAITLARAYVQQGLAAARGVGQGPGPVAHLGWPTQREHFPSIILPASPQARALGLSGTSDLCHGESQSQNDMPEAGFSPCALDLGLYPVVDSIDWIQSLLQWGVRTLQLRIKDPEHPELESQIRDAIALGKRYNARLFINDYWQLAIRHGAYGVHLGQEDLQRADLVAIRNAGLRLGLSTHGYYEIARALALRPSYIALGHIFPTRTKQMPSAPQGLERLRRYAQLLSDYPTVAIGGISQDRVAAVQASGVGSVALVTAITEAADPEAVTRTLLALVGVGGCDPENSRRATEVPAYV